MKIIATEEDIYNAAQELFPQELFPRMKFFPHEVARNAYEVSCKLKLKDPIFIVNGIEHDYTQEWIDEYDARMRNTNIFHWF